MATDKDELGVDINRATQRIIDTAFFWISFLFRGRDFIVWERKTVTGGVTMGSITTTGSTMQVYWRNGQKWARLMAREGEAARPEYVVRLIGKDY